MKRCFKCGEAKPLSAFYRHSRMADGHLNKCIECTKRDVKERYDSKPEFIKAYESRRSRSPERKSKAIAYQRRRRSRHPEKAAAYSAVRNAVLSGRLTRLPCEVCGSTDRVEAHHDDYSRPLDVRWFCFRHHRETAHGQRVMVPF